MTKPTAIDWLKRETGETLPRPTTTPKARHISLRLSDDLLRRLEAEAALHGETISQSARRLIEAGLAPTSAPTAVIDEAIAALRRARAHVASE
jgi:plasmid stability protein